MSGENQAETYDPTEVKLDEIPAEKPEPEKPLARGEDWTKDEVVAPVALMVEMGERIAKKKREEQAAQQPEPAAEPEPAVETPPEPAAPEMVKVKINHQEREVPKAEVDALGGVAAYQMTKAAEERLESVKRLEAEARRRLDEAAPPKQPEPPPPQKKSNAVLALEKAGEDYDKALTEATDRDEISNARKAYEAALSAVQDERLAQVQEEATRRAAQAARASSDAADYQRRTSAVLQTYAADLQDSDVKALALARLRKSVQDDLHTIPGITIADTSSLPDSQLEAFHNQAREGGAKFRDISELMRDAIEGAKTKLNPNAGKSAVVPELAARQERKASSPTSPSPSSVRAVTKDTPAPLTNRDKVQSYLERQNKLKGIG